MPTQEPAAGHSRPFLLYLILTSLLCGSLVMVIEVLGSRVIGPFFGASLFVWTALITVTLVALAAGYSVGGVFADRQRSPNRLYTIILVAGILVLLIPLLKLPVLKLTMPLGVRGGALAALQRQIGDREQKPPLVVDWDRDDQRSSASVARYRHRECDAARGKRPVADQVRVGALRLGAHWSACPEWLDELGVEEQPASESTALSTGDSALDWLSQLGATAPELDHYAFRLVRHRKQTKGTMESRAGRRETRKKEFRLQKRRRC